MFFHDTYEKSHNLHQTLKNSNSNVVLIVLQQYLKSWFWLHGWRQVFMTSNLCFDAAEGTADVPTCIPWHKIFKLIVILHICEWMELKVLYLKIYWHHFWYYGRKYPFTGSAYASQEYSVSKFSCIKSTFDAIRETTQAQTFITYFKIS